MNDFAGQEEQAVEEARAEEEAACSSGLKQVLNLAESEQHSKLQSFC